MTSRRERKTKKRRILLILWAKLRGYEHAGISYRTEMSPQKILVKELSFLLCVIVKNICVGEIDGSAKENRIDLHVS